MVICRRRRPVIHRRLRILRSRHDDHSGMAMVTAMMAVVNNNHFLAKSEHRLHKGNQPRAGNQYGKC
jgi:hypothetical protein